mgnify:CR=1 FL=1
MKKLPTIYKQEYKSFHNNQKICYVTNQDEIENKVNMIFDALGPIQYKKIFIQTTTKEYNTYIINKTDKELITIQNEKIPIQDIISIKRIS